MAAVNPISRTRRLVEKAVVRTSETQVRFDRGRARGLAGTGRDNSAPVEVVWMSVVKVDASTGCLLIDGRKVFPIVLSEPPPLGATTLDGKDAWAEVAAAGANFIRSGRNDWNLQSID